MDGGLVDGRYRLEGLLGKGGMGQVHDAVDTRTGRRVAIKLVRIDRGDGQQEAERRFVVEARTASAIDSPHIARVMDVGIDAARGTPYLVMERLAGEDLGSLLDRTGALEPLVAARLCAQAAAGLEAAHAQGVVHRDVKPGNLFLATRADGRVAVKILDFGIAKARQDVVGTENVGLTSTGRLLGTPLYMSPEQAMGLKVIDARSDLWSLGTVLFTALAGTSPFHGADTLGKLVLRICAGPIASVQDFAPWVSKELAAVVHRALERPLELRFQTAAEMRQALLASVGVERPVLRREELSEVTGETRHRIGERLSFGSPRPFVSEDQIAAIMGAAAGVSFDPALSTRRDASTPAADAAPARALAEHGGALGVARARAAALTATAVVLLGLLAWWPTRLPPDARPDAASGPPVAAASVERVADASASGAAEPSAPTMAPTFPAIEATTSQPPPRTAAAASARVGLPAPPRSVPSAVVASAAPPAPLPAWCDDPSQALVVGPDGVTKVLRAECLRRK
jgi:serine/threonine-protein kinase